MVTVKAKWKSNCNDGISSVGGSKSFDYTGGVQTFNACAGRTYKLEVWGAQGGDGRSYAGGYGGKASGIYSTTNNKSLKIVVGEKAPKVTGYGKGTRGGFGAGGGGSGAPTNGTYGGGAGGGGLSGVFSSTTYTSSAIIIAGGGGGGTDSMTGYPGGDGVTMSSTLISGKGACSWNDRPGGHGDSSTLAGGTAGPYPSSVNDDGGSGGGGGGYYGGDANRRECSDDTFPSAYKHSSVYRTAGGGGSNYIGGVTSASQQSGQRSGNGYAKITRQS